MTLADQVVVMNGGRIEQTGTPLEIYRRPASKFVATFIGSPAMNLFTGTVSAPGQVALADGTKFAFDIASIDAKPGTKVDVGLRPEDAKAEPRASRETPVLKWDVTEELGATRLLHGTIAGEPFVLAMPADVTSPGQGNRRRRGCRCGASLRSADRHEPAPGLRMSAARFGLETRIPPLAILTLCAALVWFGPAISGSVPLVIPFAGPAAAALGIAGTAIAVDAVTRFVGARTTFDPRDPDKAARLVTDGAYRFTRNPMYLGKAMLLAAFSIWQADPLGLLAAPVYVAYIDRFQIVPEERALGRLFGDAYADWCRHVRRWI